MPRSQVISFDKPAAGTLVASQAASQVAYPVEDRNLGARPLVGAVTCQPGGVGMAEALHQIQGALEDHHSLPARVVDERANPEAEVVRELKTEVAEEAVTEALGKIHLAYLRILQVRPEEGRLSR